MSVMMSDCIEWLRLCVTVFYIFCFIYLMIMVFVKWRRKVAGLHNPNWDHNMLSSHRKKNDNYCVEQNPRLFEIST